MKDWAEWLIEHGQADATMIAEAERVLEAAQLKQGDTVLDVGSGLGLLTLAAHDRIGDGWVIAVDPSVGALEELLRLAHEANANGVM
jgi:cyclopropane fatty-acyl-phospholipid synthase-like methyltransferase